MKILKNIGYIILFITSSSVLAQQETEIALFRHQMNLVNPAYVGVDGESFITGTLRKQWEGVKQAPETQAVSFGTPLGKNLAIGVSMINDRTFIEKQTFVSIPISYHLKLKDSIDVYFGLNPGGNFYDVNTTGLQTYNIKQDPSVRSINSFNPNVGVGALLKGEKWYASVSTPRLLNTERAKTELGNAIIATDRPHVYLSAGYDYMLNSKFAIKPCFLMRYVNGVPLSVDINTMLQFNSKSEIGATYRTDKAVVLLGSINVSNLFMFGLAFETSTRSQIASASNTYEFMLKFKF